jgi:TRAP-type uncharacterized transport system substrate-binding protein
MLKRCAIVAAVLIGIGGTVIPAAAQEAAREKVNAGAVTIISGGIEGASDTYARLAADMAATLDEPGRFRVLPMLGRGPIENVRDVLYLRGVDVGMLHSDVLTSLKQRNQYPEAQRSLRYLGKLYDEYFHVIAHRSIAGIEDLEGKPVVVGQNASTGPAISAQTLFSLLGIKPEIRYGALESALSEVERGGIAAVVVTSVRGTGYVRNIPAGQDVHLLSLPYPDQLRETYQAAEFTAEDYPNLIAAGKTVPTLGFGAIMVAYNWPPTNERYHSVEAFVTRLFGNLETLQQPPHHDRWKLFDPQAEVPGGWTRFAPAKAWVDARIAAAEAERQRREKEAAATTVTATAKPEFQAFAAFMRKERGWEGASEEELEELFKLYQDWSRQQR